LALLADHSIVLVTRRHETDVTDQTGDPPATMPAADGPNCAARRHPAALAFNASRESDRITPLACLGRRPVMPQGERATDDADVLGKLPGARGDRPAGAKHPGGWQPSFAN